MVSNEIYNMYVKYSRESMSYRIRLGQIAYKKTENALKVKFDSWNAFNGIISFALMCLCGDGNLSESDYHIFKDISGCSPTYRELCMTANDVSKNYSLIIRNIRSCGQEAVGYALHLASVIFACKGSYGRDEEAIVKTLSY